MAKILLVEDDNNLREIYEARLQAEGYTIVSAHDGEEALVVAKAEKPDLIISDVMMPKISGFEMLDILRNTDSLKGVKVIMLTALGQNDDQQRASRLGADRYLVKSQVTLEDIVNEANSLLQTGASPQTTASTSPATATTSSTTPTPTSSPAPEPVSTQTQSSVTPSVPTPPTLDVPAPTSSNANDSSAVTPVPVVPTPTTSTPVSGPATQESTPIKPSISTQTNVPASVPNDTNLAESTNVEEEQIKSQIDNFSAAKQPAVSTELSPEAPSQETVNKEIAYSPQPAGKKVIQPLPDSNNKPSINELLEQEKAKEIMEKTVKESENAPPTMSAADTAPAPPTPVVAPGSPKEGADPDSIAL